ncbi:MAG: cbb3-type cytochrome c oxidase subunit I, partial [Verrucomicrobia bacterium]|nr:cbb3-type cytochrome c oxidase subunit I [Verrucomicrobiota bacterium]
MGHDHGHPKQGFISRYVFSTDHKWIGIQYGVTALIFLFLGLCLMLMMRWQLAFPNPDDPAIPFFGKLLAKILPGGKLTPELYNSFGAMHGTIMVFLGVVPLAVGAFGNYVVPLQIGAGDMAFPKLNMASYWVYFLGGVIMLVSFFMPGGAANSGWTSYPPLANIAQAGLSNSFAERLLSGQTFWLIGMVFLITSSLLGSVNFIVTIFQLRAPGLTFMRLPFFVWAQLVTSFLLLLAFPPLEAAG